MSDLVKCPHCAGTGHTILSGVYADTLKGLRRRSKNNGYVVANQHASWFGCNPTALNNRLRRLEELGFATCEVYGREKRYRAK